MATEQELKDSGVVAIRLVICTLSGSLRCRLVPLKHYENTCRFGIGMAECILSLPIHMDAIPAGTSLTAVGEMRLIPEASTAVQLPWHPEHMAVISNANLRPGVQSEYCPRACLRKSLDYLKNAHGFGLQVGFEIEFILLDPSKTRTASSTTKACSIPPPVDTFNYGSTRALDLRSSFCDDLITTLEKMEIGVQQIHPEASHGQFELVLAPYDALTAADKLILAREAIVGLAHKSGLACTFLPKLALADAGNGCHCHFSLTVDGENAMGGMDPDSLTPGAKSFLAGLLEHLDSVCCFTTPSVNSYTRFLACYWVGAYKIIGVSNKEAPLRLLFPCTEGAGSTHCELKTFDSTANPYMGLAALVTGGICGLASGSSLPELVNVSPDQVADELGIAMLPKSLGAAITMFENNTIFSDKFGEVAGKDIVDEFIVLRKAESEYFADKDFEDQVSQLYQAY